MKKVALILASMFAFAGAAHAASFSSRSYSRPMSRPIVKHKTVVVQQRNTVIQQAAPSGGGFLSSMVGSFAGAGIATYLFGNKAEPAPAPQVVPIDCSAEANKALAICTQVK